MQEKMSLDARRELLERVSERYRFARVGEKTQILNQFLATTGYSRKHAISLLNAPRVERRQRRIRRAPRYDERVRQVLIQLWKAANCICSKRLIPFLAELIPALELFGHLSLPDDVRERVLTMSAATADRLLAPERQEQRRGLEYNPSRESSEAANSRSYLYGVGPSTVRTLYALYRKHGTLRQVKARRTVWDCAPSNASPRMEP